MNKFMTEIKPHLLRALNGPLGFALRKILSIPEGIVTDIGPNFFIIKKEEKYSLFTAPGDFILKNLYKLPFYFYIIHYWDKWLANRFFPRCNAGFDFLESIPDADPETSSVDGFALSFSGGTLTEIRSSPGNYADASSQLDSSLIFGFQEDQYLSLSRSLLVFDISSLPVEAEVSSASLRIYCEGKAAEAQVSSDDSSIIVTGHSSASVSALTAADYSSVSDTVYGAEEYADISAGANNTISLNSGFIQDIEGQSHARLALRIGSDVSGSISGWESNVKLQYTFDSADNSSPGDEPLLRIDFTMPSVNKIIMMP